MKTKVTTIKSNSQKTTDFCNFLRDLKQEKVESLKQTKKCTVTMNR